MQEFRRQSQVFWDDPEADEEAVSDAESEDEHEVMSETEGNGVI